MVRTARNFLKELPRNKDGEDLPKGTSLRKGGEGWPVRKFHKERRRRMSRIFLDLRKFLASRIFLEITTLKAIKGIDKLLINAYGKNQGFESPFQFLLSQL